MIRLLDSKIAIPSRVTVNRDITHDVAASLPAARAYLIVSEKLDFRTVPQLTLAL